MTHRECVVINIAGRSANARHPPLSLTRTLLNVSDLLMLELAMYRSWLSDLRGFDLDENEVAQLLRDTHACERLGADAAELAELLDASARPEQREALRSLRIKTGFDERAPQFPANLLVN